VVACGKPLRVYVKKYAFFEWEDSSS